MKVTPANTTHILKIIPRYTPTSNVSVYLYNEGTQIETNVVNSFDYINGVFEIIFDFDFLENEKYQIKITDDSGVLYRGKIHATSQVAQDFKATKNLYYYE